MVCLGNICRSPIAEGVLKHKVKIHGLDWVVESAGTNSYHTGEAPHKYSQKVCLENGIDISHQRARTFTKEDLLQYDKIYAFAADVVSDIKKISGQSEISNVDYFLNELHPGKNESVPDPWYGDESGYLPVYQIIERTCNAIIEKYK